MSIQENGEQVIFLFLFPQLKITLGRDDMERDKLKSHSSKRMGRDDMERENNI
jgi:hypothetical protein